MRILIPLTLLLASAAAACPTEKGYILNGQAEMPSYLTPECGAPHKAAIARLAKAGSPANMWTETYKLQAGKTSRLRALIKETWEAKPTLDAQKGDSLNMAWIMSGQFLTVNTTKIGNVTYVSMSGYR